MVRFASLDCQTQNVNSLKKTDNELNKLSTDIFSLSYRKFIILFRKWSACFKTLFSWQGKRRKSVMTIVPQTNTVYTRISNAIKILHRFTMNRLFYVTNFIISIKYIQILCSFHIVNHLIQLFQFDANSFRNSLCKKHIPWRSCSTSWLYAYKQIHAKTRYIHKCVWVLIYGIPHFSCNDNRHDHMAKRLWMKDKGAMLSLTVTFCKIHNVTWYMRYHNLLATW